MTSKDAWRRVRLDQVAIIQGGGTPSRSKPAFFGGPIPWVTPTDLSPVGQVKVLGETKGTLTRAGLLNSSAKIISAGSVLFSSRASIGKIAVTGYECATNQGFANFTPVPEKILPWFLAYLLCRYTSELTELAGKTTFLEIPKGKLKGFEVAIPGVVEQRRIVVRINECMERVDEMQALRDASRTEQLHLSTSIIESELHHSFVENAGWPNLSVDQLVTSTRNGRSIGQDVAGRANGSVLTLTSVRDVTLETEYKKSIELPESVASQFCIEKGDVFVSRANTIELVGLAAVAESAPDERLIYPDLLIKLTANRERLFPRYLAYALRSAGARRQIKDRALGASRTMVKISAERLREVLIPVPPLAEQRRIITKLDIAHDLLSNLDAEISGIEVGAIRTAILRKAFSEEM